MTVKKWKHSGTKKHSMSDREIRNGLLSEKAAEEGIVLLKNDKKILPLNISTKIGLYGAGAGKTVKGGTGSGDVNNRSNISIYQGLKENGIQIVSEKWLANYESIYAEARRAWKEKILEEAKFVENPIDAYAENPFAMPEGRAVTAEDTVDAQTAIYVVSRISGEGKDRRRVEGDYYLSRREREDIRFLDAQKIPTVLILNSGGPVELTDILEETNKYHVSYDLWEMCEGVHLYSLASIYSAFDCMLKIYDNLGKNVSEFENNRLKEEKINKSKKAIEKMLVEVKKYINQNMYDEDKKSYVRNAQDKKMDISILGAVTPFNVFKAKEKKVQNTVERINMSLRTYTGGYQRFENDNYMNGNPWPIANLWMTLYYLETGEKKKAKECFDFVVKTAGKHYFLGEQVNN